MKNLKLWMEAIAEELEKVHVSGREDIATMNKVFNTLKKLEEGGLARVEYNRQLNFRGRPAKIYTIDRSKLESGQAL